MSETRTMVENMKKLLAKKKAEKAEAERIKREEEERQLREAELERQRQEEAARRAEAKEQAKLDKEMSELYTQLCAEGWDEDMPEDMLEVAIATCENQVASEDEMDDEEDLPDDESEAKRARLGEE